MDELTAKKVRDRLGYFNDPQPHDAHWVRIKPTMTTEEAEALFREMTSEVFEKCAEKLKGVSMIVHIAFPPDKESLFPTEDVPREKAVEPNPDSPEYKVDLQYGERIRLESGLLEECHMEFLQFNSKYDFWYFTHKDKSKFQDYLTKKFKDDGIEFHHEWYFVYLSPGAHMGKHTDYINPGLRYCFSVRQPPTHRSITVDGVDHYIPTGTAYILDGKIPHEIFQDADTPRIMLLGSMII